MKRNSKQIDIEILNQRFNTYIYAEKAEHDSWFVWRFLCETRYILSRVSGVFGVSVYKTNPMYLEPMMILVDIMDMLLEGVDDNESQ